MLARIIVIVLLLMIIASLGSALVFLLRDRTGTRTVQALALRVGLSIALFLLLMAGHYMGWWPQRT